MEATDIDVVQERQRFLENLKSRVETAFNNRVQQTHIEEIKNTKEAVEESKEQGDIVSKLSDDTLINLGEYKEEPNKVSVDNPHDYGSLITLSLQKLSDEGYFDSKEIIKTKNRVLEHEFEHHVPALDQTGLNLKYTVYFIKDVSKNFAGFIPSISVAGTTQVKIFNDIVGSVKNPSAADKAHLGK